MTNPPTPQQADREAETAALVILAEHGIAPDVGELLVFGKAKWGVPPGALAKVLAHHAQQARLEERERGKPLREAAGAMLYAFAEGVDWTPEKKEAFQNLATAIRKGEAPGFIKHAEGKNG